MKYTAYKLYNKTNSKWINKRPKYSYNHNLFTDKFEDARLYTTISFAKNSIKQLKENIKDYEIQTCTITLEKTEELSKI